MTGGLIMTDATVRRMTTDEIGLMREIIAWRKAHEIEFVRRRVMGTYWVDSFGRTGPKRRSVAIELSHDTTPVMGLCHEQYASHVWYAVDSFTQAVDVLVAYGYLPARFSSAYRTGWDMVLLLGQLGEGGPIDHLLKDAEPAAASILYGEGAA
jgi:hypothetical protein